MLKKGKMVLAGISSIVILVNMGCGVVESNNEEAQSEINISVSGKVYGSAKVDFNEKENYPFTTLKKYIDVDLLTEGTKVEYSKGVDFVLSADNLNIDDSKIDLSDASVSIIDGDGYMVDDVIFNGDNLANRAVINGGIITYTLEAGDIEWNQYGYPVEEGGVEWSCQGGDGNGHYVFNMQASGIKYDGNIIDDVEFDTEVYIYGRMFDSMHSPNGASESKWGVGMFDNEMATGFSTLPDAEQKTLTGKIDTSDEIQFVWDYGDAENDKPTFCDYITDNLYVVWPENIDATGLTAEDVTLTLKSKYNDELTLSENTGKRILEENGMEVPNGDYKVFSEENLTQISINYVNWAMIPVYNKLEVKIDTSNVDGCDGDLIEEYDVASVYAYTYQMGGGLDLEGKTVTTVSINGIDDIENIDVDKVIDTSKADYYYSYGEQSGGPGNNDKLDKEQETDALYLVENDDGTYSVTENKDEATIYKYNAENNLANVKLENHTLFVTNVPSIEVEYEGMNIIFNANVSAGQLIRNPSEIGNPADGYAFSNSIMPWMAHQNWAYLYFNNKGWKE